jgi:hypothetical protein
MIPPTTEDGSTGVLIESVSQQPGSGSWDIHSSAKQPAQDRKAGT